VYAVSFQSKYRLVNIALIALLVGACQTKPAHPPSIAPTKAPAFDTTGASRYQIDSAASKVHILVYRAGAMARLGHNHVISSKAVSGTLFLQDNFTRSHVELTMPVASLVVDDAQTRSVEGEDFSAEVPQDARDGTRRNLLRPDVLDGEHFPKIELQSIAIAGTRARPELTMRITIKKVARDVPVAATLQEQNAVITVAGDFAIKQTDFGITPFSVGLGALQVQDQLRIKFSIVCRKQQ